MKITFPWKRLLVLGLIAASANAFAVTPDEEEMDKKCIKPKFRDFAPAAKSEVAPGSEITFHTSHNAEPTTIGAEAKGQRLNVNVRDRKTFYEVKTLLPAELSSTFARISIHARAADGECIGQDGWLLKIKDKDGESVSAPSNTPLQDGKAEKHAATR